MSMSMKKILNAWSALNAIEKAAASVGMKPADMIHGLKDNTLGQVLVYAKEVAKNPDDTSNANANLWIALSKLGVIK